MDRRDKTLLSVIFILLLVLGGGQLFAVELEDQAVDFKLQGQAYRVTVQLSPDQTGTEIWLKGQSDLSGRNLSSGIPGENYNPVVDIAGRERYFTVAWYGYQRGNFQLYWYDSRLDITRHLPLTGFHSAYPLRIIFYKHLPYVLIFKGNNSGNTDIFYYRLESGEIENIENEEIVNITRTVESDQRVTIQDERDRFFIETESIGFRRQYQLTKKNLQVELAGEVPISFAVTAPFSHPADDPGAMNTIVGFGDSITWGTIRMDPANPDDYQHPELAYLAQLEAAIDHDYGDVSTINKGFPGDTALDGLLRMDTDFLDVRAYFCLVMFGTNDVTRVAHFDADETAENLRTILVRARQIYNMYPVISTIPPQKDEINAPPGIQQHKERTEQLNSKIIQLAQELNIPYIDSYGAFWEYNGDWEDLLETYRGNHPSPLGHSIIAGLFQAKILAVPPSIPADISETRRSRNLIQVHWRASMEFDISHYRTWFGYTASNLNRQVTTTTTEFQFIPYVLGPLFTEVWYYRVQAVDKDGNAGELSPVREIRFD